MHIRSETPSFECRFLDGGHFDILFERFVQAFSDYARPFDFDPQRFRNHIRLNAIDLERSVGCFQGDQMVGFSLNGFGNWNGSPTVYDAGTGVLPGHRRLGAGRMMFEKMIPVFRDAGNKQFLLEVITSNDPAIKLYEDLGFTIRRELLLLESFGPIISDDNTPSDVEIRKIDAVDIDRICTFGNGQPSWQNTNEAINRTQVLKTILGAFIDGECVGYLVFSSGWGRVAQFAINEKHRGKGIGTYLLKAMEAEQPPGNTMQVINVDKSLKEAVRFLEQRGFRQTLAQYEMIMPL